MKNVSDQSVIETWARQVLGLESKSKNMSCKDGILYWKGQPIARHHQGVVLISAWNEDGNGFNPELVSKQLGIPLDKVIKMRQEVLAKDGCNEDFWWTLPPKYGQLDRITTSKFVAPNCLEDPSESTIESIIYQLKKRMNKALGLRSDRSIKMASGIDVEYPSYYHDLSIRNLIDNSVSMAKHFGLNGSRIITETKELFDKVEERNKLFKHGGPTVINQFIKDHQLSKHTPVSAIVELMALPVFKRQQYSKLYEQDLMVRQMAASEVRAKYGAKGDRKKREK